MAEIYLDQASRVITKIYWAGEITDADGAVTAEVKRCRTSSPQWISTANTYTATKLEDSEQATLNGLATQMYIQQRSLIQTLAPMKL